MIVVHGFLAGGGRIGLWAEATGPARDGPPLAHPLAKAPPLADGAGETGEALVRLPSDDAGPLPSPEFALAEFALAEFALPEFALAGERVANTVALWSVPTVLIEPGVDPEATVDAVGATPGASIGFLSDLVAFATDLVGRGRVAPAIIEERSRPTARWRPVLLGPDQSRFDELRRAMPGAACCGIDRADLLDHLRMMVDAVARSRLDEFAATVAPAGAGWVGALAGPVATFPAPSGGVASLRERLDRWVEGPAAGAVRTCFRLSFVEEGPSDDEPSGWLLEFLLQPRADPSVLVPAAQVWADVAGPLTVDDPQEVLLADLGRASRIYPDLDDALHQPRPTELSLDTGGAYRFLRHAGELAGAGFGVLVPAQWQQRTQVGLTLTVHTRQTTTAVMHDRTANLDAIVDYRWGLALGSEALSKRDLEELARAKLPLVRLRGRWVYLDPDRLRRGLAFLARGGEGQMTAGEALRTVHLFPEREPPLPITEVDGTGWLADLLTGRAPERLTAVDPPASLAARLRPYQLKGLSWLAFLDRLGLGALLADDMGLGKTVQLLALEALCREAGPRPPTLIVCPLSVLGNWEREIRRFTPDLTVRLYHGAARDLSGAYDLVLTTYQLAARDIEKLGAYTWDRIVLDEAQQVKNAATGTARALRQLPARHRVALTGTPVENRLADLWSMMDFLNPALLGPAGLFRARYSVPIERHRDEDAAARLRWVTRPLVLRRLKTDDAVITDLPEKIERYQWCRLTVEQASLYRAVIDELFAKMRERRPGNRHKGLVLSAITKLKQVCNHPAHFLGDGSALGERSGKIERLEEILDTALAEGDQALVFTQFARLGTLLQPHLRDRLGVEVAFLHGGTPKGARDRMVERFQSRTGPRVLVLSLKAGGTGLNLTAANHVVHVDRWWNPASETQATDRAFRIGQTRNVQVHTLICQGTIEERIDQLIAEKRNLVDLAVATDEGWLASLSTEDLHRLVALSDG